MKLATPAMFFATCTAVIGTMAPADAGKISATKNWTGHGSAYTSLYADVQRDCGFWTCTSWVTSVRHYSRDWGASYTTVVGKHQWGGISVSSATAGYKTGSVTLSSAGGSCTITVGEYPGKTATFEGGGRVCAAKSNFLVYHNQSQTIGRHRKLNSVKQMTITAS